MVDSIELAGIDARKARGIVEIEVIADSHCGETVIRLEELAARRRNTKPAAGLETRDAKQKHHSLLFLFFLLVGVFFSFKPLDLSRFNNNSFYVPLAASHSSDYLLRISPFQAQQPPDYHYGASSPNQ